MADVASAHCVFVPYHLDEPRPDLDAPFPADTTITVDLPDTDVWSRMVTLYDQVADVVAASVTAGRTVVVQSGDCTTSFGVVAGLQRGGLDPTIVWFDAHGDVQTLETTTSGYLGGMPLRMLAGYRPELITGPLGVTPVPEANIVLVDARDLDPPERAYLGAAGVRRNSVDGLAPEHLPDGPIYLHVDLDVVNPEELPGQLFPAPGGPDTSAVSAAVGRVLDSGRVMAVGVACTWQPGHGAVEPARRALEPVQAGPLATSDA